MHLTLGASLIAAKGYASSEVEQTYEKAEMVCQRLGETSQIFPVLWGLWVMYFVRGDFRKAQTYSQQLFHLAQTLQDSELFLEANVALGLTSVCLGKLTPGLTHLENGIKLYNSPQHNEHAVLYGQDPAVVCASWAAWALWLLGQPDQARQKIRQALTFAQARAHPYSQAYALGCAAVLHQLRRKDRSPNTTPKKHSRCPPPMALHCG
jgi:predicted ATPase